MNETAAMSIPQILFGIIFLILAAFWVLYPLFIFDQLKKLNRTAAESLKELALIRDSTASLSGPVTVRLVDSDDRLLVNCGVCKGVIRYGLDQRGTAVSCPHCGNQVTLP